MRNSIATKCSTKSSLIWSRMNRTKKLKGDVLDTQLRRCLTIFDLTLLGIGHMVGSGIYVMTGSVVKYKAGPSIIVSYILAGIASLLTAFSYAEFGARVPKAGSAYVYTYVTVGEFWAFVIGWNIVLEHLIGSASVARAWSGYLDDLIGNAIKVHVRDPLSSFVTHADPLAAMMCIVFTLLVGVGVKGSTNVNSALTMLNMAVMIFCMVGGFYFADTNNWSVGGGFAPFGFAGILGAAGTCFYAYVGYDSIATAGEEALNPAKAIPRATLVSMAVVSVGYIGVSAAVTLMVPYYDINPDAALSSAFTYKGVTWAHYLVSVGALCGMTTSMFGGLFALPRCIYAMAEDGMLFAFLAKIHKGTQLPLYTIAIGGIFCAILAFCFDLTELVEFMSIGTLLAYTLVSASVIVLRYTPPSRILRRNSQEGKLDNSLAHDPEYMRAIQTAGTIKPGMAKHLNRYFASFQPGYIPSFVISVYTFFTLVLCVYLKFASSMIANGTWVAILVLVLLVLFLIGCVLLLASYHQNTYGLRFQMPWVPVLPAVNIFFNLGLMMSLEPMTWVRLIGWVVIGLLLYFFYGITHSKENQYESFQLGSYRQTKNTEDDSHIDSPPSQLRDNV